MQGKISRIKIKLNDANNLRDLLQEMYSLADQQIVAAQLEISKLASSSNLSECIMEEKTKYAKAVNDFLMVKDKAIAKKMDIAKLMAEVIKFNGNVNDAVNSEQMKQTSFDFSKLREMLNENEQETTQTIQLTKDIKNK